MSKNIWIINEYAGSPYHGMTFRHYYLAKALVKQGHSVIIFTSSFSHYKLQQHREVQNTFTEEDIDGISYIWVKMPPYPASNSIKRVRNWFLFTIKLLFIPFLKLQKPDAVLVSSLPLHPIIAGKFLSKRYKAKLLFEVRDIWPLSAIELSGYSSSNLFIKHLQWLEDYAYKKSDAVISVLSNAFEHMKTRGLLKGKYSYIPNGADFEEMSKYENIDAQTLHKIPKNKFIIGYTGSISVANDIKTLCEAAGICKNNPNIAFVVVGDGKEKEALVSRFNGEDNIIFLDPIPKAQIQSILHYFDICYIGWNKLDLYNFGISPNKIFDYMFSGKPILHAFSGKGDLVKLANCGITTEAQNPKQVAKAIEEFYNMPKDELSRLGKNGKEYVSKHHNYDTLAKRLMEIIK